MRGWMIVASCTLSFAALAQPESTPAPADSSSAATAPAPAAAAAPAPAAGQGFGSQTRYWLATQTSGANAVTDPRPMSGEAASLVYQRYLNGFSHPIPERYSPDSFTTSNGGSGSSSAH